MTEFAENGDLKDYLKKQGGQKLAEPEASRIVSQIVEGILFFQVFFRTFSVLKMG